RHLLPFPTRRSSDLTTSSTTHSTHLGDWIASLSLLPLCGYYVFKGTETTILDTLCMLVFDAGRMLAGAIIGPLSHAGGPILLLRSEEHTSELQSRDN